MREEQYSNCNTGFAYDIKLTLKHKYYSLCLMINIYDYSDHIVFLKDAIEAKRTNKSRPLSLRTLSNKIEISPAYLSKVFNRKQTLSTDAALKFFEYLDLSESEADYFLTLLKLSLEKDDAKKIKLQAKINHLLRAKKRQKIETGMFEKIATVNYLTTLLLMAGKYKSIEAIELSKLLQIDLKTCIEILENLEQQKLVVKIRNKYQRTDESSLFFQSNVPNASLRSIYKEMLLIAIDAIDNEPVENRTIGCESFLIDQNQISKVQQIIEDCFNKVVSLSNHAKNKDHVYNLGIQLVKLTKGTL